MNKISVKPYLMLPMNYIRFQKDTILMTNMAGEYFPLSNDAFKKMVSYDLSPTSELYLRLKAKHFIVETLPDPAIDLLATKYRTKKSFLYDFTSLHMFVVTLRCNQKCIYCHASSVNKTEKNKYDMDIETARKAVDICLMSPSKSLKIEIQGGEPLLNFETVKFIIEYASNHALAKDKNIEFVVCSNLTMITEDTLKYLADNNVFISTSLDGPKDVHDFNRRYREGQGTYEDVVKSLEKARKYISPTRISALMTTTKYSLSYSHEIIDEYVNRGFTSIFIRPLNPFGFARLNIHEIGYGSKEFINFYKELLDHIISINLAETFIEEAFTSILLTRILTPFSTGFVDLQFPAGTGISGVVYVHDGNVYPSDESRMLAQMGDNSFCMGNVHKNTYDELFFNSMIKTLIRDSCLESLPGCSDCAFQLYCGVDPIHNYATQGNIVGHRPTSDFCTIHKEIIKHLFGIILQNERNQMDVFWSWLTGRNISEIRAD